MSRNRYADQIHSSDRLKNGRSWAKISEKYREAQGCFTSIAYATTRSQPQTEPSAPVELSPSRYLDDSQRSCYSAGNDSNQICPPSEVFRAIELKCAPEERRAAVWPGRCKHCVAVLSVNSSKSSNELSVAVLAASKREEELC